MSEIIIDVKDINDENWESFKFLILKKLLKDHEDDENIIIEFIFNIMILIVFELKKNIVLSHSFYKLTTKFQKELHNSLYYKQE